MNFAAYLDPETSAWVVEALAHVLWQGTLIAALAAVAALAFRSRSAPARYSIHGAAMLLTAACLPLNLWLFAPTEVIQGKSAGDPTVASPGPALPAEVATKTPASRKASHERASTSLYGSGVGEEEPIE